MYKLCKGDGLLKQESRSCILNWQLSNFGRNKQQIPVILRPFWSGKSKGWPIPNMKDLLILHQINCCLDWREEETYSCVALTNKIFPLTCSHLKPDAVVESGSCSIDLCRLLWVSSFSSLMCHAFLCLGSVWFFLAVWNPKSTTLCYWRH